MCELRDVTHTHSVKVLYRDSKGVEECSAIIPRLAHEHITH